MKNMYTYPVSLPISVSHKNGYGMTVKKDFWKFPEDATFLFEII
jgi:hypothetical protein